MDTHDHPDLLDEEIDKKKGLGIENLNARPGEIACRHCLSVRHLVRLDEGFGFMYCHWCGSFQ